MSHKNSYSYIHDVCDCGAKLDWDLLAANQNTTIDIIDDNLDEFLSNGVCWSWILRNPHITMEFVEKHIDKISRGNSIAWLHLSMLPCVSLEYKQNNPQYPWYWDFEPLQHKFDDNSPGFLFNDIDNVNPDFINWADVSSDTFNRERWKWQSEKLKSTD